MRHEVFLALALLANGALAASECTNWQQSHSEWLWCDDFESTAPLNTSYEDVSTNGLSVVAGDGVSTSKGLTQRYTTGQVDAGWIIKYKPQGFPDHVFYRYYHKFSPGYTRFPPKMSRIGYRDHATWTSIFRMHTWLTEQGGALTTDTQSLNSTQTSGGWLPISTSGYSFATHLDEWVAVEVEIQLNTPGQKNGLYRTWINNQLIIERLNVDFRGSTSDKINEVMLDCYWNGGATGNLKRSFDNFVISTQKIGLSDTVIVRPLPPTNTTAN